MDAIRTVQKAIDYMEERLQERLELERIAEAASMSIPNLYRLFYALTGHPMKEYIRKRRTSVAALMLRQTGLPVIDIAFDCGFDSYQAFTKGFKKLTGLTPGVYRKSELFYSFESIQLMEKVSYQEDRDLSDLYPDVKVIRTAPMETIAYKHFSDTRDGLEDEAYRIFYMKLTEQGIHAGKMKLFGFDIEPSGEESPYGYQMMVLLDHPSFISDNELFTYHHEGGLYAVKRIQAGPATSILTAWNRLLAEWLPRSTFMLGKHAFLEEYQHYRGSPTHLKLHLPVTKKREQETIEIVELPSVRSVHFRFDGADSAAMADEQMIAWLRSQGLAGDQRLQLFMTYSYGTPLGLDYWYELGAALPDDVRVSSNVGMRDGGLYACLKTSAYGAMTGVLDLLYRWLSQSDQYEADEQRHWFAIYVPCDVADIERSTMVECYIPIQ